MLPIRLLFNSSLWKDVFLIELIRAVIYCNFLLLYRWPHSECLNSACQLPVFQVRRTIVCCRNFWHSLRWILSWPAVLKGFHLVFYGALQTVLVNYSNRALRAERVSSLLSPLNYWWLFLEGMVVSIATVRASSYFFLNCAPSVTSMLYSGLSEIS